MKNMKKFLISSQTLMGLVIIVMLILWHPWAATKKAPAPEPPGPEAATEDVTTTTVVAEATLPDPDDSMSQREFINCLAVGYVRHLEQENAQLQGTVAQIALDQSQLVKAVVATNQATTSALAEVAKVQAAQNPPPPATNVNVQKERFEQWAQYPMPTCPPWPSCPPHHPYPLMGEGGDWITVDGELKLVNDGDDSWSHKLGLDGK